MKRKLRIAAAIAAVASLAMFAASTQASAKDVETARATAVVQPSPNTVGTVQLINNGITSADYGLKSIWGGHIHDNTIGWPALGSAIRGQITTATNTSNAAKAAADAAKAKADAADAKAQQALDKANANKDVLGGLLDNYAVPTSAIAKIGGPYATNATTVGTLTLPKASTPQKFLVNAWAMFDRLNDNDANYVAPTTDTRLQFTVRCGAEVAGSDGSLTIFSPAISPRGFTESTGSATAVVVVPAGEGQVDCAIRGFGYNEDRSGWGGNDYPATDGKPQFTVAGTVSAIRVG